MNPPKKPHTQAIAINPEFGSHAVNGWRFVLHTVFLFLLDEGEEYWFSGGKLKQEKLKKK